MDLKNAAIPVYKKDTFKFGKVWTIDETAAGKAGLAVQAKFLNDKAYVLNARIENSFLFPELERYSKQKTFNLPEMEGGSLDSYQAGELSAIRNCLAMMEGGSTTLDSYENALTTYNFIDEALKKGNLKLSKNDKDRLKMLLHKAAKYQERVVLIHDYLLKYNKLPEKSKTGKDLKKIVDKFDRLNKKKRLNNKNMIDHIKNALSGKNKPSDYYTLEPVKTFIHEMNFNHIGEILEEEFILKIDRETKKKLAAVLDELNNYKDDLDDADDTIKELTDEIIDLEAKLESARSDASGYKRARDEALESMELYLKRLDRIAAILKSIEENNGILTREIDMLNRENQNLRNELQRKLLVDAENKQLQEALATALEEATTLNDALDDLESRSDETSASYKLLEKNIIN